MKRTRRPDSGTRAHSCHYSHRIATGNTATGSLNPGAAYSFANYRSLERFGKRRHLPALIIGLMHRREWGVIPGHFPWPGIPRISLVLFMTWMKP